MHSLPLSKETKLLFQLVINLWAVLILGKMNVTANLLSHQDQTLPTEWSFNLEITSHLFPLRDSPHMDLFATSSQLLCLYSQIPGHWWWTPFLSHQLLTKVLTKLCQSNAQLLLVALAWLALP